MKRVKVILSEDVYNIGEEGDVREVASGYARNFLIPQGLALSFSKKNVAYFEQRKEAIEKRKDEKREAAQSFREKIESKVLELEMPAGDTGKLFGSVNSATIAEKLTAEGINIERKRIDVPENSIKMIGEYDVRIRLYGDEIAEIKVIVDPVGGKKVAAGDKDSADKKRKTPDPSTEEQGEGPVEAAAPAEEEPAPAEVVEHEAAPSTEPAEAAPAEEPQAEEASVAVAESDQSDVEETATDEEDIEGEKESS